MPDIEAMKKTQDVKGLIHLLDHSEHDIQWRAADALGSLGEIACDPLLKILAFPKVNVRVGVIEALGDIKSPRSVEPLIQTLARDKSNEVRWVAALALGAIGDKRAIPALEQSLRDGDRYLRYGSEKSLTMLGWQPEDDTERAYAFIAMQDWESVKKLGLAAVDPLMDILKDKNPVTRGKIIDILGSIRGHEATQTCEAALMDVDPGVRWKAVVGARKCGVSNTRLPLILSRRPWTTPSPVGAAVLNFFFFGLGYHYLQKWYGYLIYTSFMATMVFVQLYTDVPVPFIYAYPITWIFAIQTYFMVKKMHDL
jgi:HEAT repeat protein